MPQEPLIPGIKSRSSDQRLNGFMTGIVTSDVPLFSVDFTPVKTLAQRSH
jgi:hypothetical protein